ncbi:hypothetical protein B566_EDAN017922 [Ephemera danica]|nr:hypothetical protein B566_EDAN017922 [Ephemera danica]
MQPVLPSAPHELIALDLYGALPRSRGGVMYILVLIDVFTKFLVLYALKRATTRAILNRLKNDYFPLVTIPKGVLHDHGSQFTAKQWKRELEAEGVEIVFTSVRHPQSNSSERVMREIGRICRPKPDPANLIIMAREKLQHSAAIRKKQADGHGNVKILQVGDMVLLKCNKLSSAIDKEIKKFFLLFEGPYHVLCVVGPNAYLIGNLENQQVRGTYNMTNLIPWPSPIAIHKATDRIPPHGEHSVIPAGEHRVTSSVII